VSKGLAPATPGHVKLWPEAVERDFLITRSALGYHQFPVRASSAERTTALVGRAMKPTITILLVDDHAIVRQGCRLLLQQAGFEIAGEATSGEEAYASCLQHPPRVVVVVDLAMPGMGGLEAIRRIRARFAESSLVVFTMHDDPMIATRGSRRVPSPW
jgi:CheY-like chemotaxis protein